MAESPDKAKEAMKQNADELTPLRLPKYNEPLPAIMKGQIMMCKTRRSKMLNRVARLRTQAVNLRNSTQNKTLRNKTKG